MFGFGPRYATSVNVTLNTDTIVKKVDPLLMEIEVGVSQAAYDLAQTSNLFSVPRIIRYDHKSGTIEYERISRFITLGQLLVKRPNNIEILQKAGKVLANIHSHLEIPSDLRRRVNSEWLNIDSDVVPLHGDFNTVNVGCKEDTNDIIVLDWTSTRRLGPRSTEGPRYLEISHFIYSLLIQQASFLKSIRHLRQRTNAFLEGYQSESGKRIDLCILANFLLHLSIVLLPIQHENLLKRLYYTGIRFVGHIIFKIMVRQWRRTGQFTGGKKGHLS